MPGFGGFAPLPLRLGGSATDGWAAAQHARGAADLAGVCEVAPLAWITYTIAGDPAAPVILNYRGVNGVGLAHAPVLTIIGTGIMQIEFPAALINEYGRADLVCVRSAKATARASTPTVTTINVEDDNVITVFAYNAVTGAGTDYVVSVQIQGWIRDPKIGAYDGARDKEDSRTERTPYAWSTYQDYTSALGSAFTVARNGLVHARKLALSRLEAALQRGAEKIDANSVPGTADDMLGEWIEMLHLRLRGTEDRQEIRQLAAAHFASARGNSVADIDQACADLLGDSFVSCLRTAGTDLDTPPSPTYWPGVNPGAPAYDLGGGTWFSPRSHLTVNVKPPANVNDADFARLINVTLYGELSRILPAWSTLNAAAASEGFRLDIDSLDIHAIT